MVEANFEAAGLQFEDMSEVSGVSTGFARGIDLAERAGGPNAFGCEEAKVGEESVDDPAVLEGLGVWVVEDREGEALACGPDSFVVWHVDTSIMNGAGRMPCNRAGQDNSALLEFTMAFWGSPHSTIRCGTV